MHPSPLKFTMLKQGVSFQGRCMSICLAFRGRGCISLVVWLYDEPLDDHLYWHSFLMPDAVNPNSPALNSQLISLVDTPRWNYAKENCRRVMPTGQCCPPTSVSKALHFSAISTDPTQGSDESCRSILNTLTVTLSVSRGRRGGEGRANIVCLKQLSTVAYDSTEPSPQSTIPIHDQFFIAFSFSSPNLNCCCMLSMAALESRRYSLFASPWGCRAFIA
jgi:hypothetical protein